MPLGPADKELFISFKLTTVMNWRKLSRAASSPCWPLHGSGIWRVQCHDSGTNESSEEDHAEGIASSEWTRQSENRYKKEHDTLRVNKLRTKGKQNEKEESVTKV